MCSTAGQEGQEVVALWSYTLAGSDSVKKKKETAGFNMEMTASNSRGVSGKGKSSG